MSEKTRRYVANRTTCAGARPLAGDSKEGTMSEQVRAEVAYPTAEENRAARWAGWFMALTFLTSIPALIIYHSILHHDDFILGADSVGSVQFAAFLEVLLAI